MIVGGANDLLDAERVKGAMRELKERGNLKFILSQLELPIDVIEIAAQVRRISLCVLFFTRFSQLFSF